MKNQIFVLVAIILQSFVSAKPGPFRPHHTDLQDRVYPAPLSVEYVNSFRKFSMKNALAPSFNIEQVASTNGRAIQSCPATLAYLYAVLTDNVFKLETRDLVKALEVPKDEVTKVFSSVVDNLVQDRDIILTSAIFTKNEDFATTTPDLHSFVQVVNKLEDNDKAVDAINNYVANHTNNLITDQLLPSDSPFYKSTVSVVVNTAYVQKTFKKPLTPVGKKEFRVSKEVTNFVDTLEVGSSDLPIYRGEQYSAVVIKLGSSHEQKNKSVVLIKPTDSLGQLMKNEIKDIFSPDFLKKFVVTRTRVQVPVLNFTVARTFNSEYESPLKIPSFTSAICDSATDKENFLQKIVQINTFRLSSTSLELATAIAVGVDNVVEYRKEFGAGEVNATQTNVTDPNHGGKNHKIVQIENVAADAVEAEPEPEVEPQPSSPLARSILSDDQVVHSIRQPSEVVMTGEKYVPVHIQAIPSNSHHQGSQQQQQHPMMMQMMLPRSDDAVPSGQDNTVDLFFDTPFFAYLQDDELGPFAFLAVQSPVLDSTTSVPVESEDFSDYKKLSRFVCIAPPAPFLPKTN